MECQRRPRGGQRSEKGTSERAIPARPSRTNRCFSSVCTCWTASSCGVRVTAGAVDSVHLSVENVHLKIGETEVPLRSTPQKAGAAVLEYHWLEDTGRIALVLYVARDVTLAPTR
jgi:hypothetical protein